MIGKQLRKKVKSLWGNEPQISPAGRGVTVFSDDIFITSYPKSGNTWVRFLVSNLLYHKEGYTDFYNFSRRVPSIYTETNDRLKTLPRPRLLKSHEYFDPRYPKVIYVVRDARSVIVSYYYFQRKLQQIDETMTLSEFAERFINGKLNMYGTWRENVSSWVSVRGDERKRFCLIRYEDLKTNGKDTLKKISDFVGIEYSEKLIETTLEMSSFNHMRKLEKQAYEDNNNSGFGHYEKKYYPFVRSGKSQEYKEALSQSTLDLIKFDCEKLMLSLGYRW